MWKPEYAANRKLKGQNDAEYRLKRNIQSISDPEARKLYMQEYFKKNPEKFKLNEEQMNQKNHCLQPAPSFRITQLPFVSFVQAHP